MFVSFRTFKKDSEYLFNVIEMHCDLAKAQSDHSLPSHTLIADCSTRWGSVHKMVAHILIVFILWLFIQWHALKASFLVFAITVHAFYNIHEG